MAHAHGREDIAKAACDLDYMSTYDKFMQRVEEWTRSSVEPHVLGFRTRAFMSRFMDEHKDDMEGVKMLKTMSYCYNKDAWCRQYSESGPFVKGRVDSVAVQKNWEKVRLNFKGGRKGRKIIEKLNAMIDNEVIKDTFLYRHDYWHGESLAYPVGGMTGLMEFIKDNLRYAEGDTIQGRVITTFVIDECGNVTDAKVRRSLSPACDAEALRIISIMPQWVPAKLYGEPIKCKYTLPFTFRPQ